MAAVHAFMAAGACLAVCVFAVWFERHVYLPAAERRARRRERLATVHQLHARRADGRPALRAVGR